MDPATRLPDLPPSDDPVVGSGRTAWWISVFAVLASLFHLYTGVTGTWSAQRGVHVGFFLCLVFLITPHRRGASLGGVGRLVDYALAGLSLGASAYAVWDWDAFTLRTGDITRTDVWVGALFILLVLEATRRSIGLGVTLLAVVFLVYGYFGSLAPGWLGHRGLSIEKIVDTVFVGEEGIYGVPVRVMATYVTLFIVFGALLEKSGAGQFFFDLAKSVAGRFTGGPAKMSCISSALFGTVSGSAVANVIVDGWLTIPLMKRLGFQAPMAAAIEAVASTGGMLMPPIMGAAAFILADIVGLPYFTVALAAAIPAILYYLALFMAVHAYADQRGFRGLPPEQIPRLRTVMLERGYLVLPLVVIIQQVVAGYSAVRAVLLGMACVVVLSFLRRETALTPRRLWEALDQAARATAGLSMACACAGVIIAMVMYTALGLKAGTAFVGLSGGYVFVGLVLVMVLCLILGMGLPATAAYITTAVLAIPALTKLGVNPLAAHLFVFYFANISAITPPVMLASYAAAGIGGANPMRTGYAGMRIGAAGYLIPFLFVYKPALLILGVGVSDIALAALLALIQIAALMLGLQGWTPLGRPGHVERGLLVAGAVAMLHPGFVVNLVALGAIAGAVALTARAGIPRSTLERAR